MNKARLKLQYYQVYEYFNFRAFRMNTCNTSSDFLISHVNYFLWDKLMYPIYMCVWMLGMYPNLCEATVLIFDQNSYFFIINLWIKIR